MSISKAKRGIRTRCGWRRCLQGRGCCCSWVEPGQTRFSLRNGLTLTKCPETDVESRIPTDHFPVKVSNSEGTAPVALSICSLVPVHALFTWRPTISRKWPPTQQGITTMNSCNNHLLNSSSEGDPVWGTVNYQLIIPPSCQHGIHNLLKDTRRCTGNSEMMRSVNDVAREVYDALGAPGRGTRPRMRGCSGAQLGRAWRQCSWSWRLKDDDEVAGEERPGKWWEGEESRELHPMALSSCGS